MVDKVRKMKEITLADSDVWDRKEPVEGTFVKVETNVGPNQSRMYTVKTDEGEVKFWGSTVLDDKLMGIPKGTWVKIEYEGKLTGKKGTSYHSYKVFFDEGTWDGEKVEEPEADESVDLSKVFPE